MDGEEVGPERTEPRQGHVRPLKTILFSDDKNGMGSPSMSGSLEPTTPELQRHGTTLLCENHDNAYHLKPISKRVAFHTLKALYHTE